MENGEITLLLQQDLIYKVNKLHRKQNLIEIIHDRLLKMQQRLLGIEETSQPQLLE